MRLVQKHLAWRLPAQLSLRRHQPFGMDIGKQVLGLDIFYSKHFRYQKPPQAGSVQHRSRVVRWVFGPLVTAVSRCSFKQRNVVYDLPLVRYGIWQAEAVGLCIVGKSAVYLDAAFFAGIFVCRIAADDTPREVYSEYAGIPRFQVLAMSKRL